MSTPDQPESPPNAPRPSVLRYAGLGFDLAASIIGLTVVGILVDRSCDTAPVGVLVGVGLGVVGGLYNFIRTALKLSPGRGRPNASSARREPDDGQER